MKRQSAVRYFVGSAVAMATLTLSWAQTAQDFPGLKGGSSRLGRNGDPVGSTAGAAPIKWFFPAGPGNVTPIIVDNTDVNDAYQVIPPADQRYFAGSPYLKNQNGIATPLPKFLPNKAAYVDSAEWVAAPRSGEASGIYTLPARSQSVTIGATTYPVNFNSRQPSYVYTRCTASAVGSDPTIAAVPAQRRSFEWKFKGPGGPTRYYAIYMNIPLGPTRLGVAPGAIIFPQRFYVYEITYGSGQRFVDVVDTYASGGGYVRLGGGGKPTNAVFPFSGAQQISVKLYNTVPRDANGKLTMTGPSANYAVYSDSLKAQPTTGYYTASPVAASMGGTNRRVIGALNTLSTDLGADAITSTRVRGTVSSYNYNFSNANLLGNVAWQYTPFVDKTGEGSRDNDSADTTHDADWLIVSNTKFQNGEYRSSSVTTDATVATRTTYSPILVDGDYDVYAYMPGNSGGVLFGRSVRYEINEGGVRTLFTADQSRSQGYVRIGSRRFRNTVLSGPAAPLTVSVTNYSSLATDTGRKIYADALLFVGQSDIRIDSTPVLGNVKLNLAGNTTGSRSVVVAASEDGRIHALDWTGRGDDTTDPYWVYPSQRRTGFVDPNLTEGIDGSASPAPTEDSVPKAVMPQGFGQSSGLIQKIAGEDYLYIASTNGRVYCLSMAGRGDYDTVTRTPGTTRRIWTWPDDFPSVAKPALTGGISASLAFANTAAGPTIFVTTNQGRIYALDAKPTNAAQVAGRRTSVRWAFPPENQPNLPKISMTPAVEFNKLYFGTQQANEQYAKFYALNIDTGLQVWQFPTDAQLGSSDKYKTLSWLSGPATATSSLVLSQPNTVFCMNQNRYMFALNADTGGEIWSTNELQVGSSAGLSFTYLSVFDQFGTRFNRPVVMVATDNNRFVGLFAAVGDVNRQGGRRAWEYKGGGDRTVSSIATAINWMYGADSNGFLYGFSDAASGFPPDYLLDAPGQEEIVENDPRGDLFRQTRVAFVTADVYRRLRLSQDETSPGGNHPKYSDLIDPTTHNLKPGVAIDRNPAAFEWGETVYAFVYNFPFVDRRGLRASGVPIPPPMVNITFSVEGSTARTLVTESRQFSSPGTAPANTTDPTWENDGYSVLAYTFQGGGPSALPPGNAIMSTSITTSSQGSGAQQQISLDSNLTSIAFQLANPLSISMQLGDEATSIGLSVLPQNPQNLVNGSPDIGGVPKSHLMQSAGYGQHGAAKTARIYVTDRSMMGLIRPDGQGLDNVRIERSALVWQGQGTTIYKPLEPGLYPGFEDLPTSFPNRSLDYPDIRLENLRVTKDPNGNAENPVFAAAGVTLNAPLVSVGGTTRPMQEGDLPSARIFRPMPFDFEVNVPRYQPANTAFTGSGYLTSSNVLVPTNAFNDSTGAGPAAIPQGYIGRQMVYVDTSQNGLLDDGGREAFRSFVLSTAVVPDQRLSVTTPTVDPNSNQGIVNQGSLAGGFGYMLDPTAYSPWTGAFTSSFQPFSVLNEGNVNLKDVRVAKLNGLTNTLSPWQFSSSSNDARAWLDGSLNLWSNFDTRFAPVYSGVNRQIIQKARVGDTVPTTLVVNPSNRENANLGVVPAPLLAGPQSLPKVSVTIPFGFPVGTYSQLMRVIENESGGGSDETWNSLGASSVESFSDPSFALKFSVRESRLTNRSTNGTDIQIDNLTPDGSTAAFAYRNAQPAMLRTPNGGVMLAWASDRPSDTPVPPTPAAANSNIPWRLFFAGLANQTTFTPTSIDTPGGAGYSSIRDLNFWSPAAGQWFRKAPISSAGYPGAGVDLSALFSLSGGETIEPGSDKFYFPTVSAAGLMNPYAPHDITQAFTSGYIAFVGEANKRLGSVVTKVSRVFVAQYSVDAGGNITGISNPIPVSPDSSTTKGKPAIFQTQSNAATIVYPETGPNGTSLVVTGVLDLNVGGPTSLGFGQGFTSIEELVMSGSFRGAATVIDVVFTGQIKGSTTKALYRGLLSSGFMAQISSTPWSPLPMRTDEALVAQGGGTYVASGVTFDTRTPASMKIRIGTAAPVELARPGTRSVDRETGVISFESILGGRVFIDPAAGSVRVTGSLPPRNATLLMTYRPYFARLSDTKSDYSNPVVIFDNRKASDESYWHLSPEAKQTNRLVVMATRGGGSGIGTRPVMKTLRMGIKLPAPILTRDDGSVVSVAVSGINSDTYQVDPANGRIYFKTVDSMDTQVITITYASADPVTGLAAGTLTVQGTPDWITESEEALVPIEQAVNEGGFSAIVDPFDPSSADPRFRRPHMFWIVWSSTRGGVPDLYIQTVAPRLSPVPLGR